ncbi:XRE family transcriptional regulator [Streptomyces albofaciens JCM 4342]|uniref:helix-turn-helix domain-containing protein n=1 Tax=Streptomyces albofaciens TaxID=66866 RepID=UPI00123C48EC|nr:helix-turn-helix transcriptional regulator [Streptomyces albofaciens]KAA6223583.1 XRE family transcriptional regulator [Streptomyces albofaciens JCM 4342]
MGHGPVVRRRKLGAELRRQRMLAGLTSDEAARRVGWHQSKVSRIETGRSGAKPGDVELLLDAYGVRDAELRALLAALCGGGAQDGTSRRGWWHTHRDLLPPEYRDFISLEFGATRARTLETTVVPGLLQTADYARTVTRATLPGIPAWQVDELVEVRMARQEVLRGPRPLELWAVLDEAVLRREIASPRVMAAQLHRILDMGQLPHVRLQVLPFAAGVHIGITGPFVIFSFPLTSDLDVVVLDHLTSSLYLERKEDLRAYSDAFDTLRGRALSCEKSAEFIARVADTSWTGAGV